MPLDVPLERTLAGLASPPAPGEEVIVIKTTTDGRRLINSNLLADQRGIAAYLEQVARELRENDQRTLPGNLILPS